MSLFGGLCLIVFSLDMRDICFDSTMYSVCKDEVEDVGHFNCSLAQDVWIRVVAWVYIDVSVW